MYSDFITFFFFVSLYKEKKKGKPPQSFFTGLILRNISLFENIYLLEFALKLKIFMNMCGGEKNIKNHT